MARLKRATLKSIASDLGVTHTSVSNAYNNPAKVSKALRDRIIAHARSVNYEGPNPAARSLRTGRCGAIGVLFNDRLSYAFTDPHDIAFLRGISSVCEEEGANIVLIPLQDKRPETRDQLAAIVDGFILNAPYRSHPTIRQALARGLPTVVVDFDAPDLSSVLTNDRAAMRKVIDHLLALGHRDVAIVTFPREEGNGEIGSLADDFSDESHVVHERIEGCRDAFDAAGVPRSAVMVCETVNSEEGGAQAATGLLRDRPELTALVCFSDRLAHGAITGATTLGRHVPADLSVTGFDGIDPPRGAVGALRLTTVRQNAIEKGRRAAEMLLRSGGGGARTVSIDAEFVPDQSSGPAPEVAAA
ncbi:LacI family DNA-binding transcriptional regulator [Sphingomonas sp. TX0522]|uniref:LacI family DNA-binding transcriptional regulator n=1 Tax=Sphingomonas sp. TX0522 TaxID=2479205 RepID=UPI0018E05E0D|nr:LacI family DNA-binding transcriptional regulator [Sphingomonas sp. TX0522]MBI0533073.1 LacI family DNA-binding transcriptional regulator [Sphingomonas sp. TX0522]